MNRQARENDENGVNGKSVRESLKESTLIDNGKSVRESSKEPTLIDNGESVRQSIKKTYIDSKVF